LTDEKPIVTRILADGSGNESPSRNVTAGTLRKGHAHGPDLPSRAGDTVEADLHRGKPRALGIDATYTFQVSPVRTLPTSYPRRSGSKKGTNRTRQVYRHDDAQGTDGPRHILLRVRATTEPFEGPFMACLPRRRLQPGTGGAISDDNYIVDFEDFFQFALAFGKKKGEDGFIEKCDLDRCQVIDFDDSHLRRGLRQALLSLGPAGQAGDSFALPTNPSLRPSFGRRCVSDRRRGIYGVCLSGGTRCSKGYGIRIGFDPDRLESWG